MGKLRTYATHFASIGGACWGIKQAGLKCVSAIEYEAERVEYRKRNLGHEATCMNMEEYEPRPEDAADLLWTSPPCTALSSASREYVAQDDPRNDLYRGSLAYCRKLKPKYFVLENVMGLLTFNHPVEKTKKTWQVWKRDFSDLGYYVELNVLNSKYFGVPQNRERVFMVGSLTGKKGLIPAEILTIQKTFEDIMEKGSTAECYRQQSYWTILKCIARNTKKHGQEYPWKIVGTNQLFEEYVGGDGRTSPLDPYKYNILPTVTCSFDGGPTRKKVSVIDTKDGVNYMRDPTVREGARAQGFPDTWVFPKSAKKAWNFIGDAVSSPVSKAIVEHIMDLEEGKPVNYKKELTANRISRYVEKMRVGNQDDMGMKSEVGLHADPEADPNLFKKL